MLVHRMVKDIKNSKVLHKIKTKDAYTAQQLYQQFKSQHLLDDRREYDEEDLMSAYPGLSKEEAKKLFDMLQRSTDAADLSLSKDNLIDAMGSGYTPVHVQKNRQGVFIVFKSDKDGKFYIVEKRSKQLFSVATSLAMAKRIIGETEDSKSKDADPRGFKVNDQIIKGFMVYKMDKNPALFVAKNENGQQYEGSMEEIKRKIDAYWVKQDEDVMKQKMKDAGISREKYIQMKRDAESDLVEATKKNDMEGIKEAKALLSDIEADWKESVELNKDSKPKHPRWRIKDDKLFRLKALAKKTKDALTYVTTYKGYDISSSDKNLRDKFLTTSKGSYFAAATLEDLKKIIDSQGRTSTDSYTKGSADKTKDDAYYKGGRHLTEWENGDLTLPELKLKLKALMEENDDAYLINVTKQDIEKREKTGKDKFTGDPLTPKGKTIMANMKKYYGKKKGEQVFYASKNKGTISGVDEKTKDSVKSFASENDWRTAVRTIGGRVEQTGEILFAYLSGNRVAGQFDKTKGNGVLETR